MIGQDILEITIHMLHKNIYFLRWICLNSWHIIHLWDMRTTNCRYNRETKRHGGWQEVRVCSVTTLDNMLMSLYIQIREQTRCFFILTLDCVLLFHLSLEERERRGKRVRERDSMPHKWRRPAELTFWWRWLARCQIKMQRHAFSLRKEAERDK